MIGTWASSSMVEQRCYIPLVGGSNPSLPIRIYRMISRHRPYRNLPSCSIAVDTLHLIVEDHQGQDWVSIHTGTCTEEEAQRIASDYLELYPEAELRIHEKIVRTYPGYVVV